ncbi:Uncharacterised protein [Streptococcus suis]|uniref:Uncharacterized protein n=1 Tax=Streptococcus suis TaxID=1307 RepID=A0A0Z8XKI3_STRSU|nr:Uncharacterised protein [Streptococcus suis]
MKNIMEARKRVEEMEKIFNRQLELNQSLSDSLVTTQPGTIDLFTVIRLLPEPDLYRRS